MSPQSAKAFMRRFARSRIALIALGMLVLITVLALTAQVLYPVDPWEMAGQPFIWPGTDPEFPLGTDMMGRDLAAGLMHGARVSLLIGVVATAMAVMIGVSVGAIAGYHGGRTDRWLMRLTELFQTLPPFVFAIVVVAILQPTVATVTMAIGLVSWPALARLVRAEFLSLREREFVLASIAIGMGDARIIVTQILPNALPSIVVTASLNVATAILLEAGLSFLGLGDPNVMSWGSIIGAGRDALRSAWYIAALPGLAILVTVLSINLVGEGLNDALNPRLRNR
jgi:peptide/nickel transport system permease protein